MSLINQMLRDLDAQEGDKTVAPQIERPVSISSPASRSEFPVFLSGFVLLVLLVAGGWYLQPVWLIDLLPDSSEFNLSAVNSKDIPAEEMPVPDEKNLPEKIPGKVEPLPPETVIQEGPGLVWEGQVSPSEPIKESQTGPADIKQESMITAVSIATQQSDSEKREALEREEKPKPEIVVDTVIKADTEYRPADSIVNTVTTPRPTKMKSVVDVTTVEAKKANVKSLPVTKRQVRRASDEVAFETALEFFNQGRLAEAEQSLRLSLRQNPRKLEARKLLAMLLLRGERREEVGSLLDQGLRLDPGHPSFVTLRARIWMDDGENEKAISLLQQSLTSKGGDAELLSLLGSLFQQEQRFQSALDIYRRMVGLEPESARAWAGLAISLDALGRDISAVKAYRHALDFHTLPAEVEQYARQRIELLAPKKQNGE